MANAEKVTYTIYLNDKLSPGIKRAVANAMGLDNKMGGLNRRTAKTTKGFGGLGASIGKLGPYLAAAAGAVVAVKQALDLGGIARDWEALTDSIRFASGSAEEGDKSLKAIKDTANTLGISLKSSAEGFKVISGAMMGSKLQGEPTRNLFKQVSIAATAMGLSAEDTKGTFLALGQIMGKGKVQAEELRGQIGERIPGAFAIASRAMGVSQQELNKMMEQGQLVAEDFLPRFGAELQKTFGGALPKAVNSSRATWERFNNTVFELKLKLGQVLLPVITKVMGMFQNMVSFLMANKQLIYDNIIVPLKDLFNAYVNSLKSVFEQIRESFFTGMTSAEAFKEVMQGVGVVLKFLVEILKFFYKNMANNLILLIKGFRNVYDGTIEFINKMKALFIGFKTYIVELFGGLRDVIQGAFDLDTNRIATGLSKINGAMRKSVDASTNYLKEKRLEAFREAESKFSKEQRNKAEAKSKAGQESALSSFLGGIGGGPKGALTLAAAKGGKEASSTVSGVKSGRPTHINIDIGKLIETFNITATNVDDINGKVKDAVAKALFSAVNNTNNIVGA